MIADARSRPIGQAHFQETPHGVLLKLDLRDGPPGVHALHLHEVGRCDGPTFESAGAHVTVSERQHGFLGVDGPHTGDLPNIDVPSNGRLTADYFVPGVTLGSGQGSLLDADGSALVIHERQDDYLTHPAGDSGDRIACGRVVR
jgi:Cu-Zn family superoxide dismutase